MAGPEAVGFGSLAIILGAALVAVGFWVNLFSKVEARLIGIEQAVAELAAMKRQDLMDANGITADGDKYKYGQYSYDSLQYAVSLAKKAAAKRA